MKIEGEIQSQNPDRILNQTHILSVQCWRDLVLVARAIRDLATASRAKESETDATAIGAHRNKVDLRVRFVGVY
jgi:hypothetical protein